MEADPFDYSTVPLDPSLDQIRLLSFVAQNEPNSQMCCKLEVFSLQQVPRYAAISYECGDRINLLPLQCNGSGTLAIGKNLYEALEYFAYEDTTYRRNGHQWLWADAICINERDLEERKNQVSLMRQIYGTAAQTLIWLGTPSQESEEAFAVTLALIMAKENYEAAKESRRYYEMSAADRDRYGIPRLNDTRTVSFNSFFQKGWFRRVWVIQELAVSASPILVWGTHEVSWDNLVGSALFCIVDLVSLLFDTYGYHPTGRLQDFRASIQSKRPETLLMLLTATRSWECTDPKDKVYAILGISDDTASGDCIIKPDYTLEVEDLYRTVALNMLLQNNRFDILSIPNAIEHPNKAKLPSWVPDWSCLPDGVYGLPFVPHFDRILDRHKFNEFAAAPTARLAKSDFSTDKSRVRLTGFQLSLVHVIGPNYGTILSSEHTGLKLYLEIRLKVYARFKEAEDVCGIHSQRHYGPTEETMKDAYWQTLTAGEHNDDYEATRRSFEYWDTWRRDVYPPFLRFIPGNFLKVVVLLLLLPLAILRCVWRPFLRDVSKLFPSAMIAATLGRKLFRTEDGYLGLAPGGARKGDHIFLIKGCRTPMILRPTDVPGQWTLVGDGYVHGVMKGVQFVEDKCHDVWLV